MAVLNSLIRFVFRRGGRGQACLLLLLALQCQTESRAADGTSEARREYLLKAAFLYNFAQFVEWPAHSYTNDSSPVVIGVLGLDPFGAALDQFVQNERVRGRNLTVRRYSNVAEVDNCQILFIAASEQRRFGAIIRRLRGRPILTVADVPGFLEQGGMVLFNEDRNKIRFQIHLEAAKQAELEISSKLLRVAEVYPKGAAP